MLRLTAPEAEAQIEAVKGFEFWNVMCYDDCIIDNLGLSYIGETAGRMWMVSVDPSDSCLVTVHGRNYKFDWQKDANDFLISHFIDILLLAIEEA